MGLQCIRSLTRALPMFRSYVSYPQRLPRKLHHRSTNGAKSSIFFTMDLQVHARSQSSLFTPSPSPKLLLFSCFAFFDPRHVVACASMPHWFFAIARLYRHARFLRQHLTCCPFLLFLPFAIHATKAGTTEPGRKTIKYLQGT